MINIKKTAQQANARAAHIKINQHHFNPVSQLKQRFIRLSKWLNAVLI
jgi:hypothetical protein